MAAALSLSTPIAVAQTPAPHALPAGTRLDFITDDGINAETVRIGSPFRIHLARELALDGTALAPANTFARLIVADKVRRADGTIVLSIAIDSFRLRQGLLPVSPITKTVTEVTKGMLVPAKFDGSIEYMGDRLVIRVPTFVPLGTIAPNSAFTPLPALTPAPILPAPRRGATPTPVPTTFNPPEPSPTPAAATT